MQQGWCFWEGSLGVIFLRSAMCHCLEVFTKLDLRLKALIKGRETRRVAQGGSCPRSVRTPAYPLGLRPQPSVEQGALREAGVVGRVRWVL